MIHVLIVDDELSIRETFQAFLEEAGYDVTTAADFFEAEAFLVGCPCDIVVADIILPRVNDLALLQRVREIDEDIPVIMVTGEPDVSTAAEAVRYGAYDYIAKPVAPAVLTRAVGRAAERKCLLDEKRRLEAENQAYQADLEKKVAARTAELEQRNRELAALIETGHDVSATLDLTEVLKRVTQRTAQVCGAHRCTILLLAEDGETLTPIMSQFNDGHLDQEMWRLFKSARAPIPVGQVPEVQHVVRERRPLFIPNLPASSLPRHLIAPFGVGSVLIVPLISKERVIGLMALDHVEQGREFTAEHVDLAMAVGAQAATAMGNARLYERERQRVARRARMLELSRELRLSLDLPETLNRICQAVVKNLGWQQVILSLRDYETKTSRPVAMAGYDAETVANTLALPPTPFGELDILREEFRISHSYYVDRQRRDAIADYPDELIVTAPALDLEPGGWHPDDILLVPIEGREGILGFISPDNPVNRQRPTLETVQELEAFANQAATAIENARLYETIRGQLAHVEALAQASARMVTELNLEKTLAGVVQAGLEALGADRAAMYLEDKDHDRVDARYVYGLSPEYIQHVLDRLSQESGSRVQREIVPFWVRDVQSDPETEASWEMARREGFHSYIVLPLTYREQFIGWLAFYYNQVHAYDEEDERLCQAIANQAAVVIENARLFEETQQQARDLGLLYETGRLLASSLEATDVLDQIAQHCTEVFDADLALVRLVEDDWLVVRGRYFRDPVEREEVEGLLTAHPIRVGEGIAGQVAVSGQPAVHRGEDVSRLTLPGYVAYLRTREWVLAPMRIGETITGVLTLIRRSEKGPFLERDVALAQGIADQAAIAIENARLFEAEKRSIAQLRAISGVGKDIASILDLDVLLHRVVNLLADVFGYYYANILMVDEEAQEIVLMASAGQTGPAFEGYRLRIGAQGITGWVAESGEPLLVNDVDQEPRYHFVEELADTRSELTVPIKLKGKVIGVLDVQSDRLNDFDEMHLSTLLTLADQMTVAIENARLLEETRGHVARLEKKTSNLELVRQVSQVVSSSLNLTHILETTVEQVGAMFEADHSGILLFDETKTYGRVVAEYPSTGATAERFPVQGYLAAERIIADREPLVIEDVWNDPLMASVREAMHRLDIRSMLIVPLIVKGEVVGSIGLDAVGRQRRFSAEEVALAQTIANQVAIAIENARLFEETKRRAEEMTALHETTLDITAQLEVPRLLNAIIARASDLLGATGGLIHLYDPARERLVAVTSHNLEQDYTGLTLEVGEGVAGRVFQTGESLIVEDHRTWAGKAPQVVDADARSMLGVPLKWQERIIGVLDIIDNVRVGAFDEHDLRLLMPFANQAAIAIQNARLFEETQQRARQWEALTEVGRTIGSILDLDEVLQLVLAQLEQVIPYDTVSLWLREGEVMRIQAVRGFEAPEAHLGLTVPLQDDVLSQEMVSTRRPLILADAQRDERFHGLVGTEWVRSWLGAPLLSKGEVIGLVTVNKKEAGLYTAETAELALAFGQQAALAIENARLYAVQRQRAAQLESLNVVAAAISQVLDLDEVLNLIACQTAELMGAETAVIPLLSEDGTRLIYAAVHGRLAADLFGLVKPLRDEGICTWVLRNKQGFYSDDLAADEREGKEMKEALGLRTVISAPMVFKGEAIGAITAINRRDGGLFTRADLEERLQPLANQAAIAIENARLYEETKRRVGEMTALYHTSLEIGAPTDLPDLLWTICDRAAKLLDVDKGGLYLYDEAREELELVVSYKLGRDLTGTRIKPGEGVAGRIVQTGRPLIVDDYSRWDGRARVYEEEPFAAVIGAPLRWQGRVIGVITLSEETERRTFTPGDERLLALFAQQSAVAIENARLYQEAKRHVEELTALHAIDVAIASTLNLDEVLERVYEQVGTLMNVATFYIALHDEEKDELYAPVIVDQGKRLPPQTLEGGLSGWVVRTRQPLWVGDMEKEQDTLPVEAITVGVPTRSLMVLPLVVRDKLVGVISAQSYELYAFDEGHRRLFSGIASQVAIAVENARLFEETNRRLAETRLLQEVMQAAASTLDFDEVLTRTIETLHKTLGIEYLNFSLLDESGTVLIIHPSMIGFASPEGYFRLPLDGSVMGRVYQTEEPVLIPDVREVPYYFEGAPEIRSELAVPVKVAGRVTGVLNAESPYLAAFGEDDLRLFSAVAAQLGVVLENARLYKEATQRLAEAMLVQEVMLATASTLDFHLVLERTVKALHRALGIDRLGFLLPDEQDGTLAPHPSLVGFVESVFQIPIAGSLVGRAYRTGQPVLVRDVTQESAYSETTPEARSELAVPVRVGDRIVAVLHAESPQVGAFGQDELRIFTTIAGQLGVTLENARLYQKLEAQTTELSQAYDELQEINRLRTELAQNVGHELRTPLGLVKGYVELLLAGDLGEILNSQRNALQVVYARTATLERLIHNLTMLQAVPRETLALEPVPVVEVVQRALAEFRRVAEKADVVFQDELPAELPLVLGDRERLKLVFSHLVENAIKFSPGGGSITIRARADQRMVYVSIADEGIGILSEHLGRIFERFYQIDGSTTRRFGGMGVGLALVWEIVEAHGGTVSVESQSGKGSVFTVALPQAKGQPNPPTPFPGREGGVSPPRFGEGLGEG